MTPQRLVLIEWEDSHSSGEWQALEDNYEDRVLSVKSAGWLIHDGERAKIIVPHLSQEDPRVSLQGSGIMTIPASAVVRVTALKETK